MTASSAAQYYGHCLASSYPECHAAEGGLGYRPAQQALLGALTGAAAGEQRVQTDRVDAAAHALTRHV